MEVGRGVDVGVVLIDWSGAVLIMVSLCCAVAPEGQRGQSLHRECG